MSKEELPEVLILCDQDPILTDSPLNNLYIVSLSKPFGHSEYIVSGLSQSADYSKITTFICEKPHPLPANSASG